MIATKAKRSGFIPYVVAGYPTMELCESAIDALAEEGATVLELGVPYSDAVADGPVIQAASEGVSANVSLRDVLALSTRVHARHPAIPIVLFTYFNPVFRLGLETFGTEASRAGVSAVLVVDLPLEEASSFRTQLEKHRLKSVFLVSPTTLPERAKELAAASTGFVYYVSRTGVTGESTQLSDTLREEVTRLRKITDRPIAIGFGISTAEQARAVSRIGDAVVVGSAFVRLMADGVPAVRRLAREMISALGSTEGENRV